MAAGTTSHKAHQQHHHSADAHLRALAGRSGCLSSLDPESRTVLTLRAGLNGSPQSVVAVARMLGVSTLREQLLEQISVLELRGATGGPCAGHSGADTLRPAVRLTATAPWLTRRSST
jgi:DNA-directed RNA polymerase sigma subunit (sigma70/sigma32)